jgi:hypothetical protein
MSADASSIAVAVNLWGLERVIVSPGGSSYRLEAEPMKEAFTGLSTGGAWPSRKGFLVQLYRDPFATADEEADQGAARSPDPAPEGRLALFGPSGGESIALPSISALAPGYELFVLLPSLSTWYAELRKDGEDSVDTRYFALGDILDPAGKAREVKRAEFEQALKPLPLADQTGDEGTLLRSALAALGKGPWLARLRGPSGEDSWLLDSGRPEDATPVFAWAAEGAVLALCADGRLARAAAASAATVTTLALPAEGAGFSAIAASGGILAAAWEKGDFPETEAAGIVVAPIPN